MELAPLAGLANAIVDLVSTGSTPEGQQPRRRRTHHGHLLAPDRRDQAALKVKTQADRSILSSAFAGAVAAWRHASFSRRAMPIFLPTRCVARFEEAQDGPSEPVASILANMRARGDAGCSGIHDRFDRMSVESIGALELSRSELDSAFAGLPAEQRAALEDCGGARARLHERQPLRVACEEADGTLLGQETRPPLDRVGLYVPGGKASYPSSVLMNTDPGQGSRHTGGLIMVVPTPGGERTRSSLPGGGAGLHIDRVFCVGGAQAVAALALGTETVPREQDRRPRQCLCGDRQAACVRCRWHRHGCRTVGRCRPVTARPSRTR